MPETLVAQPPHSLNAKEKQYIAAAPQKEKDLFALATQMLGSSHFTGKTHGFNQWKSSQAQQPPATK